MERADERSDPLGAEATRGIPAANIGEQVTSEAGSIKGPRGAAPDPG